MDMNAELESLRSFLYSEEATEESQNLLYERLEKAREADQTTYDEIWIPYLRMQTEWFSEPLGWTSVPNMTGGPYGHEGDAPNIKTVELREYKKLLPFAPFKSLLSGDSYHNGRHDLRYKDYIGGIPEELFCEGCWGISINKPHYSFDDFPASYAWGTDSPDKIIKALEPIAERLTNLRFFELIECKRSDSGGHMSGRLRCSPKTTDSGLHSLQNVLSHLDLRELRLSLQKAPKNLAWVRDLHWWTRLEKLSLADAKVGSTALKAYFSQPMPNLTYLNLSNNPKFTDTGVKNIAKSKFFPALEVLDLRGCHVTEAGESLLQNATNLPTLQTILW